MLGNRTCRERPLSSNRPDDNAKRLALSSGLLLLKGLAWLVGEICPHGRTVRGAYPF
jgi:hypothetical protein